MDDIKLLVARFDLDNNLKLNYKEFSNMILPGNQKMRAQVMKRK